MRTQVVIVGGGPAGTLLARLLAADGIESMILELRSRDHVLSRIRAGVLEQGSVEVLGSVGLGERLARDGFVHGGVNLAFANRMFRVDFEGLIRRFVTIYGQTEVQKDLYQACDQADQKIVFEAEDVRLFDLDTTTPFATYAVNGQLHRIDGDFIAGCDGGHGVSRTLIPSPRTYERVYPFGWLGILSETPPVNDELIYNNHERGFALCSMRNPNLSRYYLQCPLETKVEEWPDDRFWEELKRRLPTSVAENLAAGPSIEKSITPLRSMVTEPMSHGRLYLAGDAAHIVPPTGAKGLNLAISDVLYLSRALVEHYLGGSDEGLNGYSETALRRVWKAVRFSWWMTTLMHRFEDQGSFGQRVQEAELDYLASSPAAQTAMAENYTGLAID
ncbi:MAG TPA: 4-hydroxybenzoate 3-monooxygenase [Acidimicrobiia bacterium]|nr:4-hydroxybenzoate 3-monooxygenase [Acidimicrobiia bacterium]